METKQCSKCKEIKPFAEYFKMTGRKHNLDSQCKLCRKAVPRDNAEYHRTYNANLYANNKDEMLAKKRVAYHKDSSIVKRYQETNKDNIARRQRIYNKTATGRANACNRSIRRRQSINKIKIPKEDLLRLIKNSTNCYWCNCSLTNVAYEIDHYIPLALGGLHHISNLVIACRFCNRSKGAKHPDNFTPPIHEEKL